MSTFPKPILYVVILLFVMGFLVTGFILGVVHNDVLLVDLTTDHVDHAVNLTVHAAITLKCVGASIGVGGRSGSSI